MKRDNIRNIAIIAHVDHGKTTLVDAMLKQTHTVKDDTEDLVMDSMELERERGITIKAKNASLVYKDVKINIVDTPGHADFGGEVERTLKMADGVLLLVDAKEGPMPQTKFVLKKALELGHKAIVVINKVDKPDANPDEALNKTFDLFVKLNANHQQLDFPIIYASGVRGLADDDLENLKSSILNLKSPDVSPLFEAIIQHIPAPEVQPDDPFALQVLALAYDNYKGRLGIGKIQAGKISQAQNAMLIKANAGTALESPVDKGGSRPSPTGTVSRVTSLQMYEGLKQVDVPEAVAGDIVAIGGFDDIHIGDVLTDPQNPQTLPPVEIEPPTIKMTFGVNTSPFAGREGKFVTSRNLRDRLIKELETNVALKVEGLEQGSDSFLVSGRGELHLAVLVETMRREGFELQVSQPEVIYHEENGKKLEPYEDVTIDVPSEHQGVIIEELGKRGGQLLHMDSDASGEIHAEYLIPTRGLIGLKNLLLTRTRGTVIINNIFNSYKPVHDIDLRGNEHGSLISAESGVSNAYGLNNAQERGALFIGPAVEVYEGMVVGKNALDTDLEINVCKTKKLSNMRSKGADEALILTPPREMGLDLALEYIGPDELVEVTPLSVRIRKKILSSIERKKIRRGEKTNA
ncbi:MAG: translational GTPase TypA [Patescibacteria group bacterium]|nr:translational GTPase TypA [Patescibacteria group bacterium]